LIWLAVEFCAPLAPQHCAYFLRSACFGGGCTPDRDERLLLLVAVFLH